MLMALLAIISEGAEYCSGTHTPARGTDKKDCGRKSFKSGRPSRDMGVAPGKPSDLLPRKVHVDDGRKVGISKLLSRMPLSGDCGQEDPDEKELDGEGILNCIPEDGPQPSQL